MASQEIEALSQALARLPGLGPRSARRAVLYLMKKRETALQPLLAALENVADKLSTCSTCGNVDTSDPCSHLQGPAPRRQEPVRRRGSLRPVGARPLAPVPGPLSRARRPPLGARGGAARGSDHRPARPPRFGRRHRRGRAGDERHPGRPDHRPLSRRAPRRISRSASASWRTAFRSVESSTISTKERSPKPCGRAARLLEATQLKD